LLLLSMPLWALMEAYLADQVLSREKARTTTRFCVKFF
jgi:hypothetical protein